MAAVITRTGKGAAITQAENDANLDSLCGVNEPQTGTTYTIDAADQNGTIEFLNASPVTATLTLISTIIAANDTSDFQVILKNIGAGAVTVTPTTDTFDDGSATKILAQYEWMVIQTDSTLGLWNIIGSSDASKVDGLDASQFLRSDATDTATGDLTLSGAVDLTGTWLIGSTQVTSTAIELNILDGVTATTAEINILDGVTASTAEINYNDITTLGTVEANKVVTANGTKDIIDVNDLTIDGTLNVDTATANTTNSDLEFTRNGTGDITIDSVPVYGFVVPDAQENIYASTTPTSGIWATVNSTTLSTASAKKAIIKVITHTATGAAASSSTYARPTGSAQAADALTVIDSVNTDGSAVCRTAGTVTVNLDSSQDLDVNFTFSSATDRAVNVYLIGYYV